MLVPSVFNSVCCVIRNTWRLGCLSFFWVATALLMLLCRKLEIPERNKEVYFYFIYYSEEAFLSYFIKNVT